MSAPLVFLDTETTGLDPARHEVWELAYAHETGDVYSVQVPHALVTADPDALRINRYWDRALPLGVWPYDADLDLRALLAGKTLVCSNPSFDTSMLRARWGVEPWHHRKIDIATHAMGALGIDRPIGLAALAEHLGVDAPDHSASGDVTVMRECYRILSAWYAKAPHIPESGDRS